ncbi:MAG: hypothetical protein L6Q68_15865 [Aquabacterium sp.]|nr:hypothetical protein [Aquabacterium sp.]
MTTIHGRASAAQAEEELLLFRCTLNVDLGDKLQIHFECMAEDADHANEQAMNAYPQGEVLHVARV